MNESNNLINILKNNSIENQNLTIGGTTPAEVFLVTFFVPLSSLLLWLISNILSISNYKLINNLEVLVLHLTLLLSLTFFSNNLLFLFIILAACLFFAFCLKLYKVLVKETNHSSKFTKLSSIEVKDFNRIFIGDYRGHLLLATSISILAVDFHFFPTKFAKTETFGWSVMDAGVGSFVILHGLCSAHGKLNSSKKDSLKAMFWSAFPLFMLGFIRLAATTAVGYHKVVSEYGKHWNFFFTLAFTKMICSSILTTFSINSGLLSIITLLSHQLFLSKMGLSEFVLSDARENIFEANKEGISSLLGFVSLYFSGVQLGQIAWKQGHKAIDYTLLLIKLCGIGFCGWILMYVFHITIQPSSRRMANLSYCTWTVSLTSLQIAVHLCHRLFVVFLESSFKIKLSSSLMWTVINYNGLFYFLLANVLTGLVNLLVNTSDASEIKSLFILVSYLAMLYISSWIFMKFRTVNYNHGTSKKHL